MGRRPGRGEQQCWTASELNLSPEQARTLDLLGQTYFQEAKRYRIELFSKRLEIKEYLTNPAVKAEVIQAKNGEIETNRDGEASQEPAQSEDLHPGTAEGLVSERSPCFTE
jgi:hypothetical protein